MNLQVSFITALAFLIMGAFATGGVYFKLDSIDKRLDRMEQRLDKLSSDVYEIKGDLKFFDSRMTKLETK